MKKNLSLGSIAFLAGLIATLVLTLIPPFNGSGYITAFALLMAMFVAFLNITTKETQTAIWVMIALLLAGATGVYAGFSQVPMIGTYLANILQNVGGYLTIISVIHIIKSAVGIFNKK